MSNNTATKNTGVKQLQFGSIFLSTIFLVWFFTVVFTIQEPTDEDCIKAESITDLKYMDIEFGSVCKSLDKMNQTMQVFDKRGDFDKPMYEENDFINGSIAAQKNAIQESLYASEEQRISNTSEIRKIIANKYLIIFGLIIYFITLIRLDKESKTDYLIKTGLPITVFLTLLVILENTNTFKIGLSRMIQATGNAAFHYVAKSEIKNLTKNEEVLIDTSYINAYSDLKSLYSIGVCMSNNQKNHITWMEIEADGFNSKPEMTEFYDKKLSPYFVEYEDAQGRKVKYHVDRDVLGARLKGITFKDCGYVDFANKTFSKELSYVMQNIDFGLAMKTAVDGKDYEGGWDILDQGFDKAYAVNNSTSNVADAFLAAYTQDDDYDTIKKQLLLYYTVEYKKSILFGNIGTESFMNYPTSETSNFANFEKHMRNAERWYDSVNKSVCIENDHLILDTSNKIKSSDFDLTHQLTFYYCMDFQSDGSITINHSKYYNPDDEKIDKKIALEITYAESRELFLKDVELLATEYKAVNDKFIELVRSIYDLDKKAIRLWNEGFVSRAKFHNHIQQAGFGYKEIFREIIGINNFNVDLAVKSYYSNAGMARDSLYNLYTESVLNANLPVVNTTEKIESQLETGRISSDLFRDQFGSQNLNSNHEPADMWDVLEAVQNRTVDAYDNVQNLFCTSTSPTFDKQSCITQNVNGGGSDGVRQLSEDLIVLGGTNVIGGFGLKTARMMVAVPAKMFANNKNSKGKAAIGKATRTGKKGLSRVGGAMSGASKIVEDTMVITGFFAYIGGNLMVLANKLSEIVSMFFNVSLGIFAENVSLMLYGSVLCSLLLVWKKDRVNNVIDAFVRNTFSGFLKVMVFICGVELFMISKKYFENNIFQMSDWVAVDSPIDSMLMMCVIILLFSFGMFKLYTGITQIFDKYDFTGSIRTTVDDTMKTVNSVMSVKQSLFISKFTTSYLKMSQNRSKDNQKKSDEQE